MARAGMGVLTQLHSCIFYIWLKLCPCPSAQPAPLVSLSSPWCSTHKAICSHCSCGVLLLHLVGPCWAHWLLAQQSGRVDFRALAVSGTVKLTGVGSPDWYEASWMAASSSSARGQHGKSSLVLQLFFTLPNSSCSPGSSSEMGYEETMKTTVLSSLSFSHVTTVLFYFLVIIYSSFIMPQNITLC